MHVGIGVLGEQFAMRGERVLHVQLDGSNRPRMIPAGSVLPAGLAIEALQWAARQLRSYDLRRPWRPAELDKIVHNAFADGLVRPRQPERTGP